MTALPNEDYDWADDLFRVFRDEGIRHVATVPDAGLKRVLELCEASPDVGVVTLTTEEEGVAMACGAWLGGERSAVLMQSSGVGNVINMLALPSVCEIPCLLVVSMRGEEHETNPWQVPVGRTVTELFETLGVVVLRPLSPRDIGVAFQTAVRQSEAHRTAVAVLVSQEIIGTKTFDPEPGP